MIVVRLMQRNILGVTVVGVLGLLACAAPAFAQSPWWHLSSTALPTYLQPGQAKDEVQEVTVSATEGRFVLFESIAFQKGEIFNKKGEPEFSVFTWNATHEEVQEGLEKIFGAGTVRVTGGPGDEEGTKPYVITWAGRRAAPMERGGPFFQFLNCTGATGPNCKESTTVKEVAQGRSDGFVVVNAVNLGDANVNPETQPVTITDKLPAGLKAVQIEGAAGELFGSTTAAGTNPLECSLESLSCTYTGATSMKSLPPYVPVEMRIAVNLTGSKSGESTKRA